MDPVAVLINLLEAIKDDSWLEALENADNLEEWLRKKGFYPDLEKLSKVQQALVVDCLLITVQKATLQRD